MPSTRSDSRFSSARHSGGDRGAVLVEYVLLLAIFILGVVVAIGSLDDSIEGETVETAAEIGGEPPPSVPTTLPFGNNPTGVSSVPPPTSPTTSSTIPGGPLPGGPPIVDAGPDATVKPGDVLNQFGSASDPDGDALTLTWTALGGDATYVSGRAAENVDVVFNEPGEHRLQLRAEDSVGHTSNDWADITVSSGHITPTGIDESFWNDKSTWTPQVEIDLFNEFGSRVKLGTTVTVQFTRPDGSTEVVDCTVNGNAEVDCAASIADDTVAWVDARIIDMTGPHIDSWESFQPGGVIRLEPGPPPNDPPTIDVGGLVTVTPGVPFTINATASDPDNDPLTHTWEAFVTGDGSNTGSFSPDDTLSPLITLTEKGQHTIRASANDGHNPDVWDSTQTLVFEGGITAVVDDVSYWVDNDTWVPQYSVRYVDDDGDTIVFDIDTSVNFVAPNGDDQTRTCFIDAETHRENGWTECWVEGWNNVDLGEVPYVDAYTPSVDTPFGVTVSLPGTPTRLTPPDEGRPSPTTAPPPTTTTTTQPPATTTTTQPPATTTTTQPPTTTTTTQPPATTTTKKPKKNPKGF